MGMCGSSKPNYPDKPVYPAPPEAMDMGPTFEVAIQNQEAQNRIAKRQASIAEGQLEIAEDRYGLAKEYRPLQEKALKDAVRGQDPLRAEAESRTDIMQRVTPAHEGLSQGMQGQRGMKADSPNVLAAHEKIGAGLAGAQVEAQTAARAKTTVENLNAKSEAVAAGRGIPMQAVRGMSGASETMAGASRNINAANANYMQVLTSGAQATYSAAVAQWNYESKIIEMNYNYEVQMAEAEAAADQGMFSSFGSIFGMVAGGIIGNMIVPGGGGLLFGAGIGSSVGQSGGALAYGW